MREVVVRVTHGSSRVLGGREVGAVAGSGVAVAGGGEARGGDGRFAADGWLMAAGVGV